MSTENVTTQLDDENPWPGLEAFEESARAFFRGRDREAESLAKRVLDSSVTVLYGRSGLGKTSLLRAGLFPLLREHNFLPIYVRFDVKPGAAPLATQLRASISKAISDELPDAILPEDNESVWEYLHRNDFELWNAWNYPLTPVIVLDQFEELFTLGERVPQLVRDFRDDLGDLAENRIPADLAARIDSDDELTTHFNLRSQNYKILVSLREDFLADLQGWRRLIPSLARSQMRLRRLQAREAFDAVYTPANTPAAQRMSPELARRVVSIIAGEDVRRSDDKTETDATTDGRRDDAEVEPALLSLFCRELNEERKRRGQEIFDAQLIEDAKTDILSNYYLSCVRDLRPCVADFIESELITEKGFRNSYPRDDAVPAHLTDDELTTLIRMRLLRLEDRYGTQRIELTHDVLTRVIREQRDRRRAEEEKAALAARAEKEREELAEAAAQREAELEQEKERQQAELEAAQKLAAAETEAKEEARELADLATKAKEEAQAHEAQLAQRTRVLRVAVAAALVVALVAAGLGLWAANANRNARASLREARSLGLSAQSQSYYAYEREGGLFRILQEALAANALASTQQARETARSALFSLAVDHSALAKILQTPGSITTRFSGDQRHAIASADDCTIQVWDFYSGHAAGPRFQYAPPSQRDSCRFSASADAQRVWTVGRDDVIKQWDTSNGQPVGEPIQTHQGRINALHYTSDRLYAAGQDGTVRAWDTNTRSQVGPTIPAMVWELGSSGTDRLFAVDDRNSIHMWDPRTGKPIGKTLGPQIAMQDWVISAGGRFVVTAAGKDLQIWNVETGTNITIAYPYEDEDEIKSVAVRRDGKFILTGSESGTVRAWNTETMRQEGPAIKTGDRPVLRVRFSVDGLRYFCSTSDGNLGVWYPQGLLDLNIPSEESASHVAMDNERNRIAIAWGTERGSTIRVYKFGPLFNSADATGPPIVVPGQVYGMAFGRSDEFVVASDTGAQIWDIASGSRLGKPMRDGDESIRTVDVSPDGRHIVTGTSGGALNIWDAQTQEQIGEPMQGEKGALAPVTSVAYSRDGERIVSGGWDRKVRIWNAVTHQIVGDPILAEPDESGWVRSVAISRDGNRIATGGGHGGGIRDDTGTVRVWDSLTHKQIGSPTSHHEAGVAVLSFSPDGQWVASGSYDGSVRLWSTETGKQIGDPIWPDGRHAVVGVAVSPVRQRILYGTAAASFGAVSGASDLVDQFCDKLTVNMSRQQWRDWIDPDIGYQKLCQDLPEG